jgi:hypothetical protein
LGRCDHAPAISLNDDIFTGVTASVAEQLTRAALRGELLQDLHHDSRIGWDSCSYWNGGRNKE